MFGVRVALTGHVDYDNVTLELPSSFDYWYLYLYKGVRRGVQQYQEITDRRTCTTRETLGFQNISNGRRQHDKASPVNTILHVWIKPFSEEAFELIKIHVISFDRKTIAQSFTGVECVCHHRSSTYIARCSLDNVYSRNKNATMQIWPEAIDARSITRVNYLLKSSMLLLLAS